MNLLAVPVNELDCPLLMTFVSIHSASFLSERDGLQLGLLSTKAGEGARVGDVGALAATSAPESTTGLAAASTARATTAATAFATALSTALTASFATATSTVTTATGTIATATASTATAGSAATGRVGLDPGLVNVEEVLLLALTGTLGLAARASNEFLAGLVTGKSLAFGELLGAAFVGLANLQRAVVQGSLLLQLLGEVLLVRLGLVLGLGDLLLADRGVIDDDTFALFLAGVSEATSLVVEFALGGVVTPAVSSLLFVVAR